MPTIEQIRAVVTDYFRDNPVKKVWLFGSYARGEATEDSDVDLLLDIDDSKGVVGYFQLAGFLGDLQDRLNKKVDFAQERMLYPRVKVSVDKEKIELLNIG